MKVTVVILFTTFYWLLLSAVAEQLGDTELEQYKHQVILFEYSLEGGTDINRLQRMIDNITMWRADDRLIVEVADDFSGICETRNTMLLNFSNLSARDRSAQARHRIYFVKKFPFLEYGITLLDGRSFDSQYLFDQDTEQILAAKNIGHYIGWIFYKKEGNTYKETPRYC